MEVAEKKEQENKKEPVAEEKPGKELHVVLDSRRSTPCLVCHVPARASRARGVQAPPRAGADAGAVSTQGASALPRHHVGAPMCAVRAQPLARRRCQMMR